MSELFQNVLRASFHGGIIIAVVLLLRLALKRAPKKYICMLWILAGLRLLLPFSIESPLSLQPDVTQLTQEEAAPPTAMVPAVPERAAMPEDVEVVYGDTFTPDVAIPQQTQVVIDYGAVAAWVWLTVACGLGAYSVLSYLELKRRVREAVILPEGVWESVSIDTAFILGYLRPRIYIPAGLSEAERGMILAHERAHLKRGDHWVKLIGFAALAIHWFNPLVWAAYLLLCRDIEMACDEYVVKDMDLQERKRYSAALISCSTGHRSIAACPVAFGEVSVKQRILSVLNYRKKSFWFSLIAVAAILLVAVCLLTDPASAEPDLSMLNYENIISAVAERDVFAAVHYGKDGENGSIGIGMVEGKALANYLDNVDWKEKRFEPSDLSSPGSVAFNIAGDYRITVYDRRYAAVKSGEEVRYYRIGRADYEAAVDMLLPPDEERLEREYDIFLGTATLAAPEWGVTLHPADVTPTGMTLYLERSGGSWPGNLMTEQYYWLEKWNGSEWEAVEAIGPSLFTTEGLVIPPDGSCRWTLNWEDRYGELSPGAYRIGKSISNQVTQRVGVDFSAEEEIDWDFYAEFAVSGVRAASDQELLDYCKDALDVFQSLESYMVVCNNEFHTYDALNNYSMQQFWVDGENWYEIVEIEEALTTSYTLCWDGQRYERGENGYYPAEVSVWEKAPAGDASAWLPWLHGYVWNAEQISVDSSTYEDGVGRIALKVDDQITKAGLTVSEYYLVFEFRERDVLSSVSMSLTSGVEDTTRNPARETVYMTVLLGSTDREEIAGVIGEVCQQIPDLQ